MLWEIIDLQICSREYTKNTEFTYTFKNRFTGWRFQTISIFGWSSWTTDKSKEFMECRETTMLEF